MEMVKCKRTVIAMITYDFVEEIPGRIVFKEGHFYPVFQDDDHVWYTTDEEGEVHVVAEGVKKLTDDLWFACHFELM